MRIDRFHSRVQADLAATMLEANGIRVRVSADDAGGLHPELPYAIGGTVVEVDDEQAEEALALLDAEFGRAGDERFPEDIAAADPSGRTPTDAGPSRGWSRPTVVVAVVIVVAFFAATMWDVVTALVR